MLLQQHRIAIRVQIMDADVSRQDRLQAKNVHGRCPPPHQPPLHLLIDRSTAQQLRYLRRTTVLLHKAVDRWRVVRAHAAIMPQLKRVSQQRRVMTQRIVVLRLSA